MRSGCAGRAGTWTGSKTSPPIASSRSKKARPKRKNQEPEDGSQNEPPTPIPPSDSWLLLSLQRLKQAILDQLFLLFLFALFLAEAVLMPRLFGLFRLAEPVVNLRHEVKGLSVSAIESSRGVEVRKGA